MIADTIVLNDAGAGFQDWHKGQCPVVSSAGKKFLRILGQSTPECLLGVGLVARRVADSEKRLEEEIFVRKREDDRIGGS